MWWNFLSFLSALYSADNAIFPTSELSLYLLAFITCHGIFLFFSVSYSFFVVKVFGFICLSRAIYMERIKFAPFNSNCGYTEHFNALLPLTWLKIVLSLQFAHHFHRQWRCPIAAFFISIFNARPIYSNFIVIQAIECFSKVFFCSSVKSRSLVFLSSCVDYQCFRSYKVKWGKKRHKNRTKRINEQQQKKQTKWISYGAELLICWIVELTKRSMRSVVVVGYVTLSTSKWIYELVRRYGCLLVYIESEWN